MSRVHQQKGASLFAPGLPTFGEANEYIARVEAGDIVSFCPVHGRDAAYHVRFVPEQHVAIQYFDPAIKSDTEVKISKLNCTGNISIVRDSAGNSVYHPHFNADIEYEGVEVEGE